MEKIKLNNQIVLMRKYVKQAKVHLINKLTKQVKLLKNRKGNEVQIQKAKRKAERFLEEITLLKKIKPDYISKLALSKASNWEDILQQKNSSLNDRCVAMLANYGAVQKEVGAFCSSNEDLVLKISDLIKQWDEKNKYSNNSSKEKIISGKTRKDDKKRDKQKTSDSMLSDEKNKTDVFNVDDPFANEGKIKTIMNDCNNESYNQSKVPIQSSEISASNINHKLKLDTSVDADENSSQIESRFDRLKNVTEIEEDLEENVLDADSCDVNENSGYEDIVVKKSSLVENSFESKHSNSDEDLDENKMETTESDTDEELAQEDLESTGDVTESQQRNIKSTDENKNNSTKLDQSSASKFIKKIYKDTNSSEKNLKVIALLNLDEVQGLDEIPVKSTTKKEESGGSEEDSSGEETDDKRKQNKRNDPFFLGCEDEDSVAEKKLTSLPQNNDCLSNKYSGFSDFNRPSQRKGNTFLERKGNSSEYNHKRNFQKFSEDTRFFREDSAKFQKGRGNFRPFQKDKLRVNSYEGKFQQKDKSAFNRNNPRNQGDFKTKGKFTQNYEGKRHKSTQNYKEERHEDNMQFGKNNGDKFSAKQLNHKKGSTNDSLLHPSWEAKRKQKELSNTSFQGKRIVFDN